MADDDRNRGYRDNDAYRRPRPQPAQLADDPLAELARLIGQQNESAPSYRQNGARSPYGDRQDAAAEQGWAEPDPYSQQQDGYRQDSAAAPRWPAASYPDQAASQPDNYAGAPDGYENSQGYGGGQYDPRYESAPQSAAGHGAAPYPSPYADPRYAEPQYQDARYADQQYSDQRYADPRYGDPRLDDPRYAEPSYDDAAQRYAEPRYPDPNFGTPQFGEQSYAAEPHGYQQGGDAQGYAPYPHQYGGQSDANAYYGAAPVVQPAAEQRAPARRRGGVVTVLAVLALAVVGTAGAFGYRAMFGTASAPVPPPVIKADTRPSKVVPATDPNAKPIQDRVGVKTEKIVPREEQPVQAATPGQPRVLAPWLAGQNPSAFPPASANVAPPASSPPQAAAPQSAASEPKRIRTVPIKPEQGAEAPASRGQARAASAAQSNNDPASARAEEPSASGPLALAPQSSPAPAQRHAARSTGAPAATPASTASSGSPFPTPIASGGNAAAATSAVTGAYAVQVTSQRSEADAQASFKSLQQQFPSVLGNRQPVIRRADLGEKGTYYRAQIPFGTQSEASEFCSSLKSAGGQCVIQRN